MSSHPSTHSAKRLFAIPLQGKECELLRIRSGPAEREWSMPWAGHRWKLPGLSITKKRFTPQRDVNPQRAFTLIETIIYIALFALLIGGAVVAVYGIIEGTGRNQQKAMLQQEGDFISAKINWAMSGVQAVNAPSVGIVDDTLSVTKWDTTAGNPIVISLSGTDVTLSRAGGPAAPLNNPDFKVTDLRFTHEYLGGTNPESVRAEFTLTAVTPNGMIVSGSFATTNYIRR